MRKRLSLYGPHLFSLAIVLGSMVHVISQRMAVSPWGG